MLSILLPGASAFMVGAMRVPTARCASAMAVDSRYDIKMAAEAAAANPPAGLSPQQAADNPELAKKIAAEQELLNGLRARLDGFPKKEGTMYYITKEKSEISENLLAALMKNAMTAEEREEAAQVAAASKAAADAEKQAAAEAKKAEVEAAAAKRAEEAEAKKAKAAEAAVEKKVAAEAKKVAAAEATAAKKAAAAEEKKRKADEAAAKKAKSKAPAEQGAGVASDGKAEAAEKKGFELPNPFAKKK